MARDGLDVSVEFIGSLFPHWARMNVNKHPKPELLLACVNIDSAQQLRYTPIAIGTELIRNRNTGPYRNFIYHINIVHPSLYTPSDTPY